MSHFASTDWNNPAGLVAQLSATALMRETTLAGTTEGTNLLTYTVPRTGSYLVSTYMKTTVASDANTSHVAACTVAYNDGSAISAKSIGYDGVTPGTLLCKTLNDNHSQGMVIRATAGTTIAIATSDTVSGTKTVGTGTYTLLFQITAL